jgi:hypothetical protein
VGRSMFSWEEDPTMQLMDADSRTNDGLKLDSDEETSEEQDPQDETGDMEDPVPDPGSAQELLKSFQALEQLVHEKSRQVDQLVEALEHAQASVSAHSRDSEEQDYLNQIRNVYDQDPVTATFMMIKKLQEDALNDYDGRMQQQIQERQHHCRTMDNFFAIPANAELGPHRNELEFLIREQGVDPETAAAIVRNIADKSSHSSARREAAARAVRNRAMVENAGEVGEPSKKDAEFDRILKKSKTLDEMFSRLSRIKL